MESIAGWGGYNQEELVAQVKEGFKWGRVSCWRESVEERKASKK